MVATLDIAWAAGFMEGEGTFGTRGPSVRMAAAQVQREPLERLERLFGGHIYTFEQQDGSRRMTYHRWDLNNARARGLMMTLFCFMSPRRRGQIAKALSVWRSRGIASALRTACPRGHAYDDANTSYTKANGRRCRTCARRWISAWYARKKAAAAQH